MREDLLLELDNEYAQLRAENERIEEQRKNKIRTEQPYIYSLVKERENLIFGTLKDILNGSAKTDDLPERMEKVSSRIRDCLREKGYPEDYLAPVYHCCTCKDTGKIGELVKEPCACFKKAYQKKLREKIGLSSDKKETFETFDLEVFSTDNIPNESFSQRQMMELFRDDCEEWANTYPNAKTRDVFLSGGTGLGKTFLLRAMAERLIERNINVLVVSSFKMLEMLRKSYFENDSSSSELLDVDVLMIDDLGSEPMMQNITIEQIFNLLNERQNKGLSTVISTNLEIEKFRERYTERIASRINDKRNCLILDLKGKDIRTGGSLKA